MGLWRTQNAVLNCDLEVLRRLLCHLESTQIFLKTLLMHLVKFESAFEDHGGESPTREERTEGHLLF